MCTVLLLDGKLPDLVFEKTNDTFARRHHLRIWRRPGKVYGKAIWAVAATHDVGRFDFSEAEHTFMLPPHSTPESIASARRWLRRLAVRRARQRLFALVQRPAVPRQTRNATANHYSLFAAKVIESDRRTQQE